MPEEKIKYWKNQISEWKKSGLNQQKYCEQKRIKKSTLGYWITRISRMEKETSFIEIPIKLSAPEDTERSSLEIKVGERFRVGVPKEFDPEHLKNILRILEALR